MDIQDASILHVKKELELDKEWEKKVMIKIHHRDLLMKHRLTHPRWWWYPVGAIGD